LLEHGGKLRRAAQRYGISLEQWMDLSTGLNPQSWPVAEVPVNAWARLPEDEDGLKETAGQYYGAADCLPVAGSQAAIQILPQLYAQHKKQVRVGMLAPAYAEHAYAWQRAGFEVVSLLADEIETQLNRLDVLLIVNPNNPTGHRFEPAQLLRWHRQLAVRGGSLIVDEAFMDPTPEKSLVNYTDQKGLIVLRSLGKFFGLAGARVGFVFAESDLLYRLAELLGPWPISGPSRIIAIAALQDRDWHARTRMGLQQQSQRLACLLTDKGLPPTNGTALFQWVETAAAESIHQQFARQAILTRLFTQPSSLRFGLPADEQQWQRLEMALNSLDLIACCLRRKTAGWAE